MLTRRRFLAQGLAAGTLGLAPTLARAQTSRVLYSIELKAVNLPLLVSSPAYHVQWEMSFARESAFMLTTPSQGSLSIPARMYHPDRSEEAPLMVVLRAWRGFPTSVAGDISVAARLVRTATPATAALRLLDPKLGLTVLNLNLQSSFQLSDAGPPSPTSKKILVTLAFSPAA